MSETVDIKREGHTGRGRYVINFPHGLEAEMTYTLSDGIMAIDHTLVPPALEGRGIALELVKRAVSDARSEGFKILPICSYVVVQFARHKEWADLHV